jgi:hypothetical protein
MSSGGAASAAIRLANEIESGVIVFITAIEATLSKQ